MNTSGFSNLKHIEARYWNSENRIVDAEVMLLEKQLDRLGEINLETLKNLDDDFNKCDLLIIAAQKVPEENFEKWLDKLSLRIAASGKIWVPALILADVSFETLNDMLQKAANQNWYFDILSPAHLESLPIRVSNLVRIHEHLKELHRYENVLSGLEDKVECLQNEISTLKND